MSVEVKVNGHPPPEVTWIYNNECVSNDEEIELGNRADKHELIITRAAERHSGIYTVKAVNVGGEAKKNIQLTVFGRFLSY